MSYITGAKCGNLSLDRKPWTWEAKCRSARPGIAKKCFRERSSDRTGSRLGAVRSITSRALQDTELPQHQSSSRTTSIRHAVITLRFGYRGFDSLCGCTICAGTSQSPPSAES